MQSTFEKVFKMPQQPGGCLRIFPMPRMKCRKKSKMNHHYTGVFVGGIGFLDS